MISTKRLKKPDKMSGFLFVNYFIYATGLIGLPSLRISK